MEKMMRCFTLLLVVGLLGGTDRLAAQETVETRGIMSEIKIDEVIFGHMTKRAGRVPSQGETFDFLAEHRPAASSQFNE
jgi:hypothetical protein